MKFFITICIILCAVCVSCKKEKAPSTPGAISGPKNLCPGDSGINYSIDPVEGSTFYLWTVPDDAKIISGQGTTSIKIKFGKTSGSICVKSNNKKEFSDASCQEITQGGVSNSWCREMDFKGGGRTQAVGFSIGNKGYIGTGGDILATQHNDLWEFDPDLNLWTQKANFGGVGRLDAVGFSIGNKGYIGTGYIGIAYLNDFWEYDPILNQWTQKAYCSDVTRGFAFGFSIGNKGYIGSGSQFFSIKNDFYEYDPTTDQWTQKADVVVPRNGGIGFSIGNKGYLGVGAGSSQSYNDFWVYDPSDTSNGFDGNNNPMGKWTPISPFPGEPRYAAIGFSMGDKGYIGLGWNGSIYYNNFFEYNPINDQWQQKADFIGESRAYAVGFAIGKNGYVGTGDKENQEAFSNFWVYGQQ